MTGTCTLRSEYASDGSITGVTVLQADPVIEVAGELVDEMRRGNGIPHCAMDGDILTINGTNRRVIYRLGGRSPDGRSYRAEWPD